ncbi:MAG: NAD-dependent epimerase/dehydratase family protein [Bdellovibrionales bacterium]|nr:NAD-dependent epimerase/dehydratase family protein [Bdellovibrionales bacterium]
MGESQAGAGPIQVAVTGANGFLGALICKSLVTSGIKARALIRRNLKIAEASETVQADYANLDSLMTAIRGCEVLVHCAGGGKSPYRAEIFNANLESTRALLEAVQSLAPEDRPKHFLLISSVAATGGHCDRPTEETLAKCTAASDYGQSKWQAEKLFLASDIPGLRKSILRLPALYGIGDARLFLLLKGAVRGTIPIPHAQQKLSLLDAEDAANAVTAMVQKANALPNPFITYAEEGKSYTFREITRAIADELNPKARFIEPPRWVLKTIAGAGEAGARLFGIKPDLTFDKLRDLFVPAYVCDSSELQSKTGWRPKHQLRQRIRAIFESMPKN